MPTTVESLIQLLGLILVFILVVVVCHFTTKFVAGRQLSYKRVGNFEVVETFPIAPNKYLQLIRMGSKYVVISVSKDSVTYITELTKEEVCMMEKNQIGSGKSFKDILSNKIKHTE